MNLEGIHHVTAVTGDGRRNVDFYARLLGLRLVWQGVNADDPNMRHLAYGDETGSPGSILTFFDVPGASPGVPGTGMVHRISWRVKGEGALDFWERRLADEGVGVEREVGRVRFDDPEGLGLEIVARDVDEPLLAASAAVPEEHALRGFDGVRAYADDRDEGSALLEGALDFEPRGRGEWLVGGEMRRGLYVRDPAPDGRGRPGAGTVHHVAFTSRDGDHESWRERVLGAGMGATPVLDRMFFRSVYFREPGGVLFEIATEGPGFVFEPTETLGESLVLIGGLEDMRPELERRFPLLPNPRVKSRERAAP